MLAEAGNSLQRGAKSADDLRTRSGEFRILQCESGENKRRVLYGLGSDWRH